MPKELTHLPMVGGDICAGPPEQGITIGALPPDQVCAPYMWPANYMLPCNCPEEKEMFSQFRQSSDKSESSKKKKKKKKKKPKQEPWETCNENPVTVCQMMNEKDEASSYSGYSYNSSRGSKSSFTNLASKQRKYSDYYNNKSSIKSDTTPADTAASGSSSSEESILQANAHFYRQPQEGNVMNAALGMYPQTTQCMEAMYTELPQEWPPRNKLPSDPLDDEGLNFNFKPRSDFATEVTFTIEPRKKPRWQQMMTCGFRPMITCGAPPFVLPSNFQQPNQFLKFQKDCVAPPAEPPVMAAPTATNTNTGLYGGYGPSAGAGGNSKSAPSWFSNSNKGWRAGLKAKLPWLFNRSTKGEGEGQRQRQQYPMFSSHYGFQGHSSSWYSRGGSMGGGYGYGRCSSGQPVNTRGQGNAYNRGYGYCRSCNRGPTPFSERSVQPYCSRQPASRMGVGHARSYPGPCGEGKKQRPQPPP